MFRPIRKLETTVVWVDLALEACNPTRNLKSIFPRWWFQIFFIFTPTWGDDPIWLIFSDGLKLPTSFDLKWSDHWMNPLIRQRKVYWWMTKWNFKDSSIDKKDGSDLFSSISSCWRRPFWQFCGVPVEQVDGRSVAIIAPEDLWTDKIKVSNVLVDALP